MRKFTQKLSVFLLTSITLFSSSHKKVKAGDIDNINYSKLSTDISNIANSKKEDLKYDVEYEDTKIEEQIRNIESYYRNANVTKDCILLLNYPYLKARGYKIPNSINTSDLNAIQLIKNTENGWNTLNFAFILRGDNDSNAEIDPENWRELEKVYLNNFVKEISQTRVIKYAPLLLEDKERKDAEDLENLCYSIYQEYYDSNGNINSLKLNRLIRELIQKINNEELYQNRSNGYYLVISEILGQFRNLFTLIDINYVELNSITSSRVRDCLLKYTELTSYIIINENIYDDTFGLYCYHPYDDKYKEIENKYNKVIENFTGREIVSPKIGKYIFDIQKIKRYYLNRLSTIMRVTENYNFNFDIMNSNFIQILNNEYIINNNFIYVDDNYDNNNLDTVYETIATIYRLNLKTMRNNYNPESLHYSQIFVNNDYTALLAPYSDLMLSEIDYDKSKEIENIYNDIINEYILSIRITYSNESYISNYYVLNPNYYNELELNLDSILELLNDMENKKRSQALDIILGITIKQMNDYIEGIILAEKNYSIPNKDNIIKKIEKINKKANKLFGNHLEEIINRAEEQKQKEQIINVLVKAKNYNY